ncbi:MAG: hypothetical protein MUF71_20305 [Candidatus Kapabacteria bacterium]|jgi:hypothetical protein|nr:hypothetical protein [Candidatus Kapabacteria bacterium]
MKLTPTIEKSTLLTFFRNRADESLEEIARELGITQYREQSAALNQSMAKTEHGLTATLKQTAGEQQWSRQDLLSVMLLIQYTKNVVMLERRNEIWQYDYMSFSRRIGEIWEPFCKLCFECPLEPITLFVPPLFADVKKLLSQEVRVYIESLPLQAAEKQELLLYYDKVWLLVTSGDIKLELDLHFESNAIRYNVDFKSGFGSNEKGNTNRLLLVAAIYRNLLSNYRCLLFVRSAEHTNNHYFQTLKHSGLWEAYCGNETCQAIAEYSGFDIRRWIDTNVAWFDDFSPAMTDFLRQHSLTEYLVW